MEILRSMEAEAVDSSPLGLPTRRYQCYKLTMGPEGVIGGMAQVRDEGPGVKPQPPAPAAPGYYWRKIRSPKGEYWVVKKLPAGGAMPRTRVRTKTVSATGTKTRTTTPSKKVTSTKLPRATRRARREARAKARARGITGPLVTRPRVIRPL